MKVSLNRIMLFVYDVEGLKNFYRQHFELELLEEIKQEWVVLQAGNCEIALHKAGPHTPNEEGNNVKLVFEITGDLRLFREELLSHQVTMKEIRSFNPAYLVCDGTDPEGNVFQLMQKTSFT